MENSGSECRQAADPPLRPAKVNGRLLDNFSTGVPSIDSSMETIVGAIAGRDITANQLTINNYAHYPVLRQMNRRDKFRFNVPTPTPNYKGRQDTLKKIESYFTNTPENTSSCWDQIVAIAGLGGMGKTETAYKFAAEFQAKFPNAARINAETKEAILQSFLGLAKHLGLVTQEQSSADVNLVKEVYRQMDQANCGSVLLIFDNAIKLSSAADEPGILDYLPTDSLPNGRFPNIIITTQTQDWGRHIETLQVGGLSEEESLACYQSCFKVHSPQCTEELKKLHVLLEGYPLVMSLFVSQIDFDPDRDKVGRLKDELSMYIKMFEEKQKQFLHEKVDPGRGNKYDKTLSTVWKITCDRLVKYPNGPEALEVVQIMSFLKLPIDRKAVKTIFFLDSEHANLSKEERRFRLQDLIRVLDKFHIARILQETHPNEVCQDHEDVNCCGPVVHILSQLVKKQATDQGQLRPPDNENDCHEVGIHRLIQLVVRQETDCSTIIDRVLCYLTQVDDIKSEGGVKTALLFTEIAQKNELSLRTLTYLGFLTCQGSREACEVFRTRERKTEVEVALCSSFNCIRGNSVNVEDVNQVLRELRLHRTPDESLRDPQFFADITFKVLLANDSKSVDSLHGIEELLTNSILRECSIDDLKPGFADRDREAFYRKLRWIYTWILKAFIQSDALDPGKFVGRLAECWIAILGRLNCVNPKDIQGRYDYLMDFWSEIDSIIKSPDSSQLKIVELVRCLWDLGLGERLIQGFQFFKIESNSGFLGAHLKCFEVCLNGMRLKDERVEAVVLAFFDHLAMIVSSNEVRVLNICVLYACALWVKLLLMDDEPPSQNLTQSWCRVGARQWIKISLEVDIKTIMEEAVFIYKYRCVPKKYFTDYFPQFILKKSSSEDPEIQHLVLLCRHMIEACEAKQAAWRRLFSQH